MRDILREPLLHFLLLGLGLFVLFELATDGDSTEDPKTITVSEDTLLTYLQYRSRAFDPAMALARLRNMPAQDLKRLIEDFVREEALYREALSLGLDNNDYIIKRRLVQSIEFITTGFATAGAQVSDDDVRNFYDANRERYREAPFATFTHVFFSSESRSREAALALAKEKLEELNADDVAFQRATQHGEYFPYATNYVERQPPYIAGQFGAPFAKALFGLAPDESEWHGPLESPLGFHVVMMVNKSEARIPPLDAIVDSVRYDAEQDAVKALTDKTVQGIVDTYTVHKEFGFDDETSVE